MGNRYEGFNPKYNRFAECYDNDVIFKEVRQNKLTSPKSEIAGVIREKIDEKMEHWLLN